MIRNLGIAVSVDLARVRDNAQGILSQTGVPMIAVVKADAYGLGAEQVAGAIGDLVEAFYVFDSAEAVAGRLWDITNRRTIALNSNWTDAGEFLSQHIQPVVWSIERARQLRAANPVLSIDTGQQRFACPAKDAADIHSAGDCREVMTHAVTMEQVDRFAEVLTRIGGASLFQHAAGSALLAEPRARLNVVRPGLALYRGAARVVSRLLEARDSSGPAGYTGFIARRFGVILGGYSHGLKKGPCMVNGRVSRVLEVGMQSSFVELHAEDRVGDEVVLLGTEAAVDESALAEAWGTSPQEVLVRMTGMGPRIYR